MVGCVDGGLKFIGDIDGNISDGDSFAFIDDAFLNLQVGAYSSAFVLDLDNDSELDLFLGQDLGGVFHLENQEGSNLGLEEFKLEQRIQIYPNPFENIIHLRKIGFDSNEKILISDFSGKMVAEYDFQNQEEVLNLSFLDSGIYIIQCLYSGQKAKIIKL
jgi:hypothetical protein